MDPFLTLDNETVVTKAEVTFIGTTRLSIEKKDESGIRNAICEVPGYKWESDDEFSDDEKDKIIAMIKEDELFIFSKIII